MAESELTDREYVACTSDDDTLTGAEYAPEECTLERN